MKQSYKIALGGLIMALSIVIMALTTVIPIASFAFPAVAGVLLILLILELNKKWALLVYIGVSILSVFVSSDHTAIISYIAFFGYYPILKEVIEKMRKPLFEWIIKYIVFNLALLLGVGLTLLIFGKELLMLEYKGFGEVGIAGLVLGCNAIFAFFDIALTRLITFIIIRILPIFRKFK